MKNRPKRAKPQGELKAFRDRYREVMEARGLYVGQRRFGRLTYGKKMKDQP